MISPHNLSFSRLLPPSVAVCEQYDSLSGSLHPEEEHLLGNNASPFRRTTFAAGRTCARQALADLGIPAVAILRGAHREPLWPDGIVGSITHCETFCASAVARSRDFLSIGIDAEPNEPVTEDVLPMITVQAERNWLEAMPRGPTCWSKVLFSAKESIYKAWFPVMRSWLGFEHVEVTFDLTTATFSVAISPPDSAEVPPIWQMLRGRYEANDSLILTSLCIPG